MYPSLPYEQWVNTKDTIHLYIQITGKIKLKLMPRKNHWWFITLRVSSRGLTTQPIPFKDFTFEIEFDFIDHLLVVRSSKGTVDSFPLADGLCVADFYTQLFDILNKLNIIVKINKKPYDHKCKVNFDKERDTFRHYDKDYVHKFFTALTQIDAAFKEFSGRFTGKISPVQFFWHSFDLAVTRFSGRRAQMEGGRLSDREAYSHEVISHGFWPGDETTPHPAFYSYTYPSPEGIDKQPLAPENLAQWFIVRGSPMAVMMYEDIRKLPNTNNAIIDFCESTYQAGANLAGWDVDAFKVRDLV